MISSRSVNEPLLVVVLKCGGRINFVEVCHCKIWNYGEPTEDLSFCTGKNLTCFKDVLQDFGRITSFTDNDNRTYECYEVKIS